MKETNYRVIFITQSTNPAKRKKEIDNFIKEDVKCLKKQSGVWAMFGKQGKTWECVQVAKKTNIGEEIEEDLSYMISCSELPITNGVQCYHYNQFAEFDGFKYIKSNSYSSYQNVKLYKKQFYKYIFDNYACIAIVVVAQTKEKTDEIEKEFAWAMHCKFWKNGRSFIHKRENYYLDNVEKIVSTEKRRKIINEISNLLN